MEWESHILHEVSTVFQKWDTAKSRNSTLVQRDLDKLRAQGYDVEDAQDALATYKETERSDFDSAEDYSDARTEAWDEFILSLDQIEKAEV